MPLKTGDKLGSFEILSAIGAGGQGEVYKARDTRLDRLVAIKVLPAHLSEQPELRERFEREARTISRLSHPHICTLHDVGVQNGVHFLVMEYLEGQTLADRLAKGALPLADALRYAIEIADALDKAHRQGVVHRDLKPGNIMITKSGAKLLDFGLARQSPVVAPSGVLNSALPTAGVAPLTAEGTILGTLQYMSPEQLEGLDADARSDVFAFGAVLYEMLTGRQAFQGRSQSSVIAAIMNADPPEISTLQPLTPPILERVVKMCLAKDPDNRWQTAHDLQSELEWIANNGSQKSPQAAVDRQRRLPWTLVGLLPVIVLALAIAVGRDTFRPPDTPLIQFEVQIPPAQNAYEFAISPDGRKLAYIAAGANGSPTLFVRTLDSVKEQLLPATELPRFVPFWSPDSLNIAFATTSKLYKVDTIGGLPQPICDRPTAGSAFSGAWNSDGIIIFSDNRSPIYRVPAAGGTATQVTTLDKSRQENSHLAPRFLPDNRHFLYYAVSSKPEDQTAYVASLDGKVAQQIPVNSVAAYVPAGFLVYQRNGVVFAQRFDDQHFTLSGDPKPLTESPVADGAFSVSSNGVLAYRGGGEAVNYSQLVWHDGSGKAGLAWDADDLPAMDLSPDGSQAALDRNVKGNRDVWLLDLVRGRMTRLTFDAAVDGLPIWSPNGREIAFESNREGRFQLYIKPTSGAGQEQRLRESSENEWPYDFSRDGKYLLYSDAANSGDIWALPLVASERTPIAIATTPFTEQGGAFSPDGRWVAYQTNESGRFEVVVQPFPEATGKWQVSTTGGVSPRWSADGKELYFVSPDSKMMASTLSLADGAFSAGAPTPLFPVRLRPGPGVTGKQQYSVSRDGRFLMNEPVAEKSAPITVVVNWPALLNKK